MITNPQLPATMDAQLRAILEDFFRRFTQEYNPNIPTGGIILWDLAAAPEGWLLCDGAAVSRKGYVRLFKVIGTTYGAGDGSTTFNVPNVAGYIIRS